MNGRTFYQSGYVSGSEAVDSAASENGTTVSGPDSVVDGPHIPHFTPFSRAILIWTTARRGDPDSMTMNNMRIDASVSGVNFRP